MTKIDRPELLRAELLQGVGIAIAGTPLAPASGGHGRETIAATIGELCASLGARTADCPLLEQDGKPREEAEIERTVERALAELDAIDLLAVDGAGLFAAAGVSGGAGGSGAAREALAGCLDATWGITRAVAARAFIAPERGGRIVLVAPPPGAGRAEQETHAVAALSALENLGRTLSIEWARYAITTVTIAPAASTTAAELAQVVAYLASPAGAYFSGCLLDLRGPDAPNRGGASGAR